MLISGNCACFAENAGFTEETARAIRGEFCRRSENCFYHFEAVKADGVFCIRAEVRIIRGYDICRRSSRRCEGVSRVHSRKVGARAYYIIAGGELFGVFQQLSCVVYEQECGIGFIFIGSANHGEHGLRFYRGVDVDIIVRYLTGVEYNGDFAEAFFYRFPAVRLTHGLEAVEAAERFTGGEESVAENGSDGLVKLFCRFEGEKLHVFKRKEYRFRFDYNRNRKVSGVVVGPYGKLFKGFFKAVTVCRHVENGGVNADKARFTVVYDSFNVDFEVSQSGVKLVGERYRSAVLRFDGAAEVSLAVARVALIAVVSADNGKLVELCSAGEHCGIAAAENGAFIAFCAAAVGVRGFKLLYVRQLVLLIRFDSVHCRAEGRGDKH